MSGYTPTIPQGNQTIASTTSSIQQNFSITNTAFGVDHTALTVSPNQGQHKQVTFGSNNVPSGTVNPPVLFTNGTLPQLYFYSGTPAQGANQYVINSPGSVLLMGGIIMKWGTYTIMANQGAQTVSYTSAFPNGTFVVDITPMTVSVVTDYQYLATGTGVGGFTGRRSTGVPTTATYFYIAIGN